MNCDNSRDRPDALPAPRPGERWSLFLDFDGTLAELAEHPDAVHVPPGLPPTLRVLREALAGRLAVVSGRSIDAIDRYLGLPCLAAAGLHGLESRGPDGVVQRFELPPGGLAAARDVAARFAAAHPGLLLEDKGLTLALHYRTAPALAAQAEAFMTSLAEQLPEFQLLAGKMVLELKPRGVDKGIAVRTFMARVEFAGTTPVFAGDDRTDEDAFAAVRSLGGAGIKVGGGATSARYRVADVTALLGWLEELKCRLSTSE